MGFNSAFKVLKPAGINCLLTTVSPVGRQSAVQWNERENKVGFNWSVTTASVLIEFLPFGFHILMWKCLAGSSVTNIITFFGACYMLLSDRSSSGNKIHYLRHNSATCVYRNVHNLRDLTNVYESYPVNNQLPGLQRITWLKEAERT